MIDRSPPAMAASDKVAELRAFDATREGVKGLVDAGVTRVPPIFLHPPDEHGVSYDVDGPGTVQGAVIPVVDIGGAPAASGQRRRVVEEVRRAAETWGFFQLVNHGVPEGVLEEALRRGRQFFEQDDREAKAAYYSRDPARKVSYQSNYHLYTSPAADWRDTLFCAMAPDPPAADDLPPVCRDVIVEYSKQMLRVGRVVFELLSEALGLHAGHLSDVMGCADGHQLLFHYYPPCPQPELTLGTTKHSDPDFLTILLQDHIGGLQVLHEGCWVDVSPLAGALVVNIGDLLQIMSNDRFVSVEHRVVANRRGPRTSVACFFSTGMLPSPRVYGPAAELLSGENPPVYGQTSVRDYLLRYNSKGLDGRSALSYLRLPA